MAHVPSSATVSVCTAADQRADVRVDDAAGQEELKRVGRNVE